MPGSLSTQADFCVAGPSQGVTESAILLCKQSGTRGVSSRTETAWWHLSILNQCWLKMSVGHLERQRLSQMYAKEYIQSTSRRLGRLFVHLHPVVRRIPLTVLIHFMLQPARPRRFALPASGLALARARFARRRRAHRSRRRAGNARRGGCAA